MHCQKVWTHVEKKDYLQVFRLWESWEDISYLFFYFSCLSGLNYWCICVVQLLPPRTTTFFSFSLNIQQGGLRKGYTMHIYRCISMCCADAGYMHYFFRIQICIVGLFLQIFVLRIQFRYNITQLGWYVTEENLAFHQAWSGQTSSIEIDSTHYLFRGLIRAGY